MRSPLLFLLLASVSMPAIAADEASDRAARRAERAEARSERQAERQSERQVERAQEPAKVERAEPVRSVERRGQDQPVVLERAVPVRVIERRSDGDGPRPTLDQRREDSDSVRTWRQEERERIRAGRAPGPKSIEAPIGSARETLQERRRDRIEGRDSIGNRRAPIVSRVPREGTQPPPPPVARSSSQRSNHWSGNWRSNHRYDWRNHRRRHRSLFNLGFYFDPFGWGYRPYSIGWRLWPHYYRSSYWLNDPWQYRLPYAPPGHRWIRYYDDALLVDTWDGQVVDVIYNFFW